MNKSALIFLLTILSFSACNNSLYTETNSVQSANELTKRLLPDHFESFLFEEKKSTNNKDYFDIRNENEKIKISANNAGNMAAGLYWYLKKYCNSQISINYHQLNIPEQLPKIKKDIHIETPFKHRYFFNYCTYGYSMPWWNWEKWEKVIDYMALQGVNMPLAIIGQEAVWMEVYKELGMTEEQIDNFFVGPAHLPWGWMGNIDSIGGPLPDNWIKDRTDLQKKILKRMRSLGMKPVLQGFTGHVPKELKNLYPESNIFQIEDWAGIPGTMFLDPTDELFQKIGELFIKKQASLYGTDHYYDADCFIEVNPPSNDPEFLKKVSTSVYQSMAKADPEAIWVIQGWFFFFKKDFWQEEQGKAFLEAIPENKAIILDLYGEKNPTWKQTKAFYGQPWIWNVICNEDQKINMSGDLETMQINFREAFNSEINNNLKGIGVIPEGIGFNPIVQEFIFEKTWDQNNINIKEWTINYVKRRYNTTDSNALKAWELFLETVYGRTRTMWSPLITTPRIRDIDKTKEDIRHVRKEFQVTDNDPFVWDFDVYKFHEAAFNLLKASKELENSKTYQFDLVNAYRELLQSFTHRFIHDISYAYQNKDLQKLDQAEGNLLKLLDDLEAITGSNENFMLGNWLKDAKSWGQNSMEKSFYEWNARTIISIWQPWKDGYLRDYAGKAWNGMFSGYYKPRWELFINFLRESIINKTDFDPRKYDLAVREIDFKWTKSQEKYPFKAYNNAVDIAYRIEKDYAKYFIKKVK